MRPPRFTREQIEAVSHLSSREAAKVLGTGKSTINELRARYGTEATDAPPAKVKSAKTSDLTTAKDGSLIVTTTDSVPQTKDHIDERMKARGFDPEDFTFGYRFSEWDAQTPDGIQTLYSARATAAPKPRAALLEADAADTTYEGLLAALDSWVVELPGETESQETFIFCFADPQIGKVDFNGGTDATVARFMLSLDRACTHLEANPVAEIIWADLGDGIENFCNVTSQRQTNDLNLVEQVRVLRRLQLEGLMRLSAYAPVVHISVPSNHSQNRTGVGSSNGASTSHDDWGLEVQHQLQELVHLARPELIGNLIQFKRPKPHYESVAHTTVSGTKLGLVHGHRSTSQNALEGWFQGQALGRQPVGDVDILLVGHFHNLGVKSVGDERYIITTPALDNGSSWFTVARGHAATAGVLALRVEGRKFPSMEIL